MRPAPKSATSIMVFLCGWWRELRHGLRHPIGYSMLPELQIRSRATNRADLFLRDEKPHAFRLRPALRCRLPRPMRRRLLRAADRIAAGGRGAPRQVSGRLVCEHRVRLRTPWTEVRDGRARGRRCDGTLSYRDARARRL